MNPELKKEEDYRELARLGKVLGVPVFEAFLTVETFDKKGKRTSYHKQRSHSWTRNAYNLMFMQLASKDGDDATTFGGGFLNIKNTGGAVLDGSSPASISDPGSSTVLQSVDTAGTNGYLATSGEDAFGILVGTGTNAESFEDYALQTKIASGNAATELAYGAHDVHAETYTAGTKTYEVDLVRYFNNNSGGSITVNEVGLAAHAYAPDTDDTNFLVARDKLGSGVAVADTGQLRVTYTISLVFAG